MQNINKNLILFLIIIFVFGVFFAEKAFAWDTPNPVSMRIGVDFTPTNDINVWNGSGNNNNTTNPVPSIYSVSPTSSNLNSNTTITVSGTNFVMGSVIRFNNVEKPTTYLNSGTLRAQLNSYELSNTGSFPISVYNPGPGGGISNTIMFNVANGYTGNSNANGTTVSTVKKTTTVAKTNTTSSTSNIANSTKNTDSNLAANAIFGAGSFIPGNFLQWLIVMILILLIVFLWRKIYVTDQDRAIPLKHA